MSSLSRTAPRHDAAVILQAPVAPRPPPALPPPPPAGPYPHSTDTRAGAHGCTHRTAHTRPPGSGALVSGLACPVDGLHSHSRALSAMRGRASARQGHLARAHTHKHITVPQALHGSSSCGIVSPRFLLFPRSSSACCRESAGFAPSSISARAGISENSGTGKR